MVGEQRPDALRDAVWNVVVESVQSNQRAIVRTLNDLSARALREPMRSEEYRAGMADALEMVANALAMAGRDMEGLKR